MINDATPVADDLLKVLDGVDLRGGLNVDESIALANVQSSIRRGHPQVRPQPPNYHRIAVVGGGPSLADTEDDLVALIQDGAKLATVNGGYRWCLDRHLTPNMQILMDARVSNARFVDPPLPRCDYFLASQCAPETWDAVAGRASVHIFHAAAGSDGPLKDLLDQFYLGNWVGVGGGTTVVTRAIFLLRTLGFLRFDLFGVDSCFMRGQHHAFPQIENERDQAFPFWVQPPGHPEARRVFSCAPWHVKQFEDFLQLIRVNGDHFLLNVYGDGLIAYALQCSADLEFSREGEDPHGSPGI